MGLSIGVRLGPYEVLAPLGAGGMGEVYRAKDERLGREVALKILPESFSRDEDRLQRFEREARAAGALNHPNLLTIHDVGTKEGFPYLVSEMLEGTTLRTSLMGNALPVRKALDYAVQIARGLAAAHDKGVVHRDIKPENLFITRDGRVKILDFGLAKLTWPLESDSERGAPGRDEKRTMSGVVMGTAGYMAPEQIQGRSADHRADIFALGAILYEMLSGRPPFHRASAVETMNAAVKEDPAELSGKGGAALERIVRRCLEKAPDERFQSARDVAFALEALSNVSAAHGRLAGVRRAVRRAAAVLWALCLVAAGALASLAYRSPPRTSVPTFHRLTFRRGSPGSARFAPDGQTVAYAARWEGRPLELFSTRPDSTDSTSLGLPPGDILSMSRAAEMALLLDSEAEGARRVGTLARASLAGGPPRALLESINGADWAPDGRSLAIVRRTGEKRRLEFPVGTVLYETENAITEPRVSPDGSRVAFLEIGSDMTRSIAVVDRAGKRTTLSKGWGYGTGHAWHPGGREVWFTLQGERDQEVALYAVDLRGRTRAVARFPTAVFLKDISSDGRVLVSTGGGRSTILWHRFGEAKERDLSWSDWTKPVALSADGKSLLLNESLYAGGTPVAFFLRRTDGSPALRLGEGEGLALSPDARWVISVRAGHDSELVLSPTGAGEPRTFTVDVDHIFDAEWLPDGKGIVFEAVALGKTPRQSKRLYRLDLDTGNTRPITPEGVGGWWQGHYAITSDGRYVVAGHREEPKALYPMDGGAPRPIPGLEADDEPCVFSGDGQTLYIHRHEGSGVTLFRLEVSTGRRELVQKVLPADPAGTSRTEILMTADGSWAFSYASVLGSLYVIEGLL